MVPLEQIRSFLLDTFSNWTKPGAIRTDNGEPFGVPTRDVIPIMSLWLVAWGITPILNRPRRPQDNANVECTQGITGRWAEVDNCPNLATLQKRLDEAAFYQREIYRVKRIGYTSRKETFKDLFTNKRPFQSSVFDAKRAYEYLAQAILSRKVSSGGTISIYAKAFQAGLKLKGKVVFLQFNSDSLEWIIKDKEGNIIKNIPDPRFAYERLFNLNVCQ